jgi:hypothetical protein
MPDRPPRLDLRLLGEGVGEAVGVGAGFDDGAVEGEPVNDGGAQAGVGEGFSGPAPSKGEADLTAVLP